MKLFQAIEHINSLNPQSNHWGKDYYYHEFIDEINREGMVKYPAQTCIANKEPNETSISGCPLHRILFLLKREWVVFPPSSNLKELPNNRYIICDYLLPFSTLSFCFVDDFLHCTKLFSLMWSLLFIFVVTALA